MTRRLMAYRSFPCGSNGDTGPCPWLISTPPGEFAASRFEKLRATSVQPDMRTDPEAYLDAAAGRQPLFACHSGKPGDPDQNVACAGWLLSGVAAQGNLSVRTALAEGALPHCAVIPDDRTPPLYQTYDAMAEAQGDPNR